MLFCWTKISEGAFASKSFLVTKSYNDVGSITTTKRWNERLSTLAVKSFITTTTTTTLYRQPDKWDLILDELEDEEDDIKGRPTGAKAAAYLPCPPDMAYEPRIVQRAHQTFYAIRAAGGKEMTNDVYVRDPENDREIFWYTGKVARVSDVSLEDCIQRLYPMIERHACHLRPNELYPHRGSLEVWTAPGDSEVEVAYNKSTIRLKQFIHSKEWQYNKSSKGDSKYPLHIKAAMVGFQGEVYQEGEDGFRTWRNDDGMPARPEINVGGETQSELETMQRELMGGDVDDGGIIDAVVTSSSKNDNEFQS
jgi:hypothetical protein